MNKPKPPFPLTLPNSPGAIPVTRAILVSIVGEAVAKSGEEHGDFETFGPWGIPLRYTAHAVSAEWADGPVSRGVTRYTFHGKCTAHGPKSEEYHLECRVSIGGKKRSGFTSSVMFEVSDPLPGEPKLVQIAVIHVRAK